MSLKVSRCLPFVVSLFLIFATLPASAQSIPCAAITRNPQALQALVSAHAEDAGSGSAGQDDLINAIGLQRLHFDPIVIQPGDALYMEVRGRDFSVKAQLANGDFMAFDSKPTSSYEEWHQA